MQQALNQKAPAASWSGAKDIYDFKSGSEDEEPIKMVLPSLKELREFSDEDNKPLKLFERQAEKTKVQVQDEEEQPLVKKEEKPPSEKEVKVKSKEKEKEKEKDVDPLSNAQQSEPAAKHTTSTSTTSTTSITSVKKQAKRKIATPMPSSAGRKKKTVGKGKAAAAKEPPPSGSSAESSSSEDERKLSAYSGPKRHRMASLNALAKVQCLYENESRTAHELGLSKATQQPPRIRTLDGSDDDNHKDSPRHGDTDRDKGSVSPPHTSAAPPAAPIAPPKEAEPRRELRYVPGGRGVGKHWEFDSDSETEELQLQQTLPPVKKKKLPKKAPPKKVASSETDAKRKKKSVHVEESDDEEAKEKEKEKEKEKPKPPKQLPKKRKTAFTEELIGDYKGILARKRMASLNASAIVAATYEVERHLDKNLASDCSSFESYDELDTMPTTTSKVTSAAAIKTEVIHIKKEPKESKESLRERERERESERRRERDNELKDSTVGKMSSHSIIEESNDSKY